MGKIPRELREAIAANIRACRMKAYPGRGGGKKCAEAFGVSPQQWSPWERGMRTPDELRLSQLADFFGVTVEYLRRDHSISGTTPNTCPECGAQSNETRPNNESNPRDDGVMRPTAPGFSACPFYRPPKPGQPWSGNVRCLCWLAERLFGDLREHGIAFRLHPDDIDLIFERYAKSFQERP